MSTDIPAGNGVVVGIEGDTIRLRPDQRGQLKWWFSWHVSIRGAAGRRLRLAFPEGPPCIGPAGVAWSEDLGRSWRWSGAPAATHECELAVPRGCEDLRVAMSIPYTGRDLDAAITGLPGLRCEDLCTSNGGRAAPLLRLGATDAAAALRVVLTCRHHCCESMASFVLDGALAALATDPELAPLRGRAAIVACPLMDVDGVEQGDQGKFRAPHDHNADYEDGRYPETVALRALVTGPGRELPTLSLDLHCPWIRGRNNEHVYIVGCPDPTNAAAQAAFAEDLAAHDGDLLGFTAADILPYGTDWNVVPADRRRSCSRWLQGQPSCRLAATFEIPYGLAKHHAVTPQSARTFGAALAHALQDFADRSVPATDPA